MKNSNQPKSKTSRNAKLEELTRIISEASGSTLTTNQGLLIKDDTNSLKGGERDPSLLEDFHLREKITHMKKALTNEGAIVNFVAARGGTLTSAKGTAIAIDFSLLNAASVLFDAVYVPGGKKSVEALKGEAKALHFLNEAFNHCKAIAAGGDGVELLRASFLAGDSNSTRKQPATPDGVIIAQGSDGGKIAQKFVQAIAQHRHWSREKGAQMPA